MKKIASLFKRDYEGNRQVLNEVVEGSEWVTNGEGVATVKWDGTCCKVKDGILYKRYQHKEGNSAPDGFILEQIVSQQDRFGKIITKHFGWLKVTDIPSDKYHNKASLKGLENGTYELVGEKIQNNPHKLNSYVLIRHGDVVLKDCPRDFEGLKTFLEHENIEGIVWHHPDDRMVKIKKRDFGFKW